MMVIMYWDRYFYWYGITKIQGENCFRLSIIILGYRCGDKKIGPNGKADILKIYVRSFNFDGVWSFYVNRYWTIDGHLNRVWLWLFNNIGHGPFHFN